MIGSIVGLSFIIKYAKNLPHGGYDPPLDFFRDYDSDLFIDTLSNWSLAVPDYPPVITTFYKKVVSVDGFPVVSSFFISDEALLGAAGYVEISLSSARCEKGA